MRGRSQSGTLAKAGKVSIAVAPTGIREFRQSRPGWSQLTRAHGDVAIQVHSLDDIAASPAAV